MIGIGLGFGLGARGRNAFDRLPFHFYFDPHASAPVDTIVSGAVDVLTDLSGRGQRAHAENAGHRMALTTLRGRVALQGAAGKRLISNEGGISLGQPCTYLIAADTGSNAVELMFDGFTGAYGRQGVAKNGLNRLVLTHGSATGTPYPGALPDNTPVVIAAVFAATDSASRLIVRPHGHAAEDITTDPDGAAQAIQDLTIGATFVDSNHWTGKIGTLAAVQGTLAESDLQAALAALQARYGITTT